MTARSVRYEVLLASVLRENALTLFDPHGAEQPLDYARHLDRRLEVDGPISRETHLQLLMDLWASWEVHLERSNYTLPHLGAVHVEANWISGGVGGPPCVLLMNQAFFSDDEVEIPCPCPVEWKATAALGPLRWTKLEVEGTGTCYRAYLMSDQ